MKKHCDNCKYAGHNSKKNVPNNACLVGGRREFKFTTNSKTWTHCNKFAPIAEKGKGKPA
jgi:hypothetical protein